MPGYVFAQSPCVACRQVFAYNPHKVPSVTVHGHREPICEDCVNQVNPVRIANGLDPIVPLPGAYEALPEEEL